MAIRQILHTWMLGDRTLADIAGILLRIGADGADLSINFEGGSNPERLLHQDPKGIFSAAGLGVYSVSALYFHPDSDLSQPDKKAVRKAVDFTKQCVEVAVNAGCDRLLVSPSLISVRHHPHISYEEDWKRARESLAEAAEYASQFGVMLMIEPINRYRVFLVHTLAEAKKMIDEIGKPNIKIVPDVYHMIMEETESVVTVLEKHSGDIACLHLGDTARTVPGRGALDWNGIFSVLKKTGFDGPLSHEPIILYFDELRMGVDEGYAHHMEHLFSEGIAYVNSVMTTLGMR